MRSRSQELESRLLGVCFALFGLTIMNIEIIDDEEAPPKRIGRCAINLGGGCGRAILDSDHDAVPLDKDGMICGDCYSKMFTAVSWSSQKDSPLRAAQSRGGQQARARQKAREQGRPIGAARTRKKVIQYG